MKLILMEIWSYAQLPLTVYLFKKFANRNVIGDMIAGTMLGCFIEFATEPLWDYHFRFTVYKDIAPSIVLGWGQMFAVVVFASEKLYMKLLKKPQVEPYDKKIFIFDVIAAVVIAVPLEKFGLAMGVWDYRLDLLNWNWGTMPFINMPYEAVFGYALLMLVGPTFVRYWQGSFEGAR
jgi:hypothetical protein